MFNDRLTDYRLLKLPWLILVPSIRRQLKGKIEFGDITTKAHARMIQTMATFDTTVHIVPN